MGECTMLILQKYGFNICVISFDFYSKDYKVYIHIPWIITQRQTTAPFDTSHVISFRDFRKMRLYQVSVDCCDGNCNSNIINLLQASQKIHCCKQSVLVIVQDLNTLVWCITNFDLISRSALVHFFSIMCWYLYNLTRTKVLQFWCVITLSYPWLPLSRVSALYCY